MEGRDKNKGVSDSIDNNIATGQNTCVQTVHVSPPYHCKVWYSCCYKVLLDTDKSSRQLE